jgi:glycosyltransferase 2 family protein
VCHGSSFSLGASRVRITDYEGAAVVESYRANERATAASWKSLGYWLFGLLVLMAVIAAVLRVAELRRFAQLMREMQPGWLMIGAVLQGLTYVCAASVWHAALARAGAPRSLRSLVPLGIAKLFSDQALPSGGISGTLLVIRGLARRDVPAHLAMGALLVGLVSFYTAYGLAAIGGLVALHLQRAIGPAVVAAGACFVLFVVGIPVTVLCLRWLKQESWLHRFARGAGASALLEAFVAAPSDLLRDFALIAETTALQLAIFLLDAATLGVMLSALGQTISPIFVFGSFMVADVVAFIGPIPLGLGVFEGTAVAMLTMTGVSIEAALAATLLLRGFTFWLPMVPGIWLAHRELGSGARGALKG